MNDAAAGWPADTIDAHAVRHLVDYLADRIDLATLVARLRKSAQAHEAAGRADAAVRTATLYLAFVSQLAGQTEAPNDERLTRPAL